MPTPSTIELSIREKLARLIEKEKEYLAEHSESPIFQRLNMPQKSSQSALSQLRIIQPVDIIYADQDATPDYFHSTPSAHMSLAEIYKRSSQFRNTQAPLYTLEGEETCLRISEV